MSKELKDEVMHAAGHVLHAESVKTALGSAGTAAAAGLATMAPFAPAVVVAVFPAILIGAAVWGLCKLFD